MNAKCLISALMPVALLGLGGGCATMEGKWSLASVEPTAARSDFAYESLTLQNDGTFYAEARKLGGSDSVSGTWKLTDGVLLLKEKDGVQNTYDAKLDGGGQRLQLTSHWDGRRLIAMFERQENKG